MSLKPKNKNQFHPKFPTAEDWAKASFDKELLSQIWSSRYYNHQDHSPHVLARFRARGIYNVYKRAHAISLLEQKMNQLFEEVRGEKPPTMAELIDDEGETGAPPSDDTSKRSARMPDESNFKYTEAERKRLRQMRDQSEEAYLKSLENMYPARPEQKS